MPRFHRHATPTTNTTFVQQPATIVAQPVAAPVYMQTMGYQAGGPLVTRQTGYVQQQPILTKGMVSTTGLTTQMSSTTLVGGKQTIVKPAIIEETVRTDTFIQVQPIVHREIDQQRIHHVEQHITERAAPAMGGTVTLAPIVQETVLTNIIEEVQPVIHREIATRAVERIEEHLTERINAPVVHTTGVALGAGQATSTISRPAIIDERIRTDRLVQIQPIVHREIDQQRIHHVEQHITERSAPAMGGTVKLAPIVQETIINNLIEEVQPVIHRERAVQQVQVVEEHLAERIAAPVVHTTGASLGGRGATVVKPALIDERVRTDRMVEIQPVVHREITQPRIHHVEQHITERAAPAMGGTVKLAPIVQETVLTNVIEEVQPVIHRERAIQQVERVEEHLTERVAAPAIHTTGASLGGRGATVVKPALIDQRMRTDRLVEIQPVVHREITQPRVHHIEQHITERAAPTMGGTVKLAPIVQETVRTNVVEEVQPVIHREIATRSVERVEEHLTERVAAPAIHTTGVSLGAQANGSIVKPALIDQRMRTDRVIEVQPVVHREITQPRVHHVEQHITERAAVSMAGTVKLAPIVQQTVRTNTIEEVQPVIHREVATRSIERVEEHLTERVAAPAIHTHAVQSSTNVQSVPLLTQGAPLTQGALPLTQGALPISNNQGMNTFSLQKAPLTAPLAQPFVSAGGPAPVNLARPL